MPDRGGHAGEGSIGRGGCIRANAIDFECAALNDAAGPDEWTVDSTVERVELYVEVAGAMKQTARKGIRRVIRRAPSEHDVEDVVLHAFNELWEMDRSTLTSATGMGCRIAHRRGLDRGDRVLREQRNVQPTDAELLPDHQRLDVVNETEYAALMAILARCMEDLTVDQRAVIAATFAGRLGEEPMLLSEWVALQHGTKTYEAWRRQRKRGVESLRKCIERDEANVG